MLEQLELQAKEESEEDEHRDGDETASASPSSSGGPLYDLDSLRSALDEPEEEKNFRAQTCAAAVQPHHDFRRCRKKRTDPQSDYCTIHTNHLQQYAADLETALDPSSNRCAALVSDGTAQCSNSRHRDSDRWCGSHSTMPANKRVEWLAWYRDLARHEKTYLAELHAARQRATRSTLGRTPCRRHDDTTPRANIRGYWECTRCGGWLEDVKTEPPRCSDCGQELNIISPTRGECDVCEQTYRLTP